MSFEEIYKNYAQSIYRLCRAYVNDIDLAKDLTQDTFSTVWQSLSKFRNESSISTWVYRIAINKCLRSIELGKRFQRGSMPVDLPGDFDETSEEAINQLYYHISLLEEMDRVIISLQLEEISQARIATIVGISEANVRVKIHRIKQKLTQKMKSHG